MGHESICQLIYVSQEREQFSYAELRELQGVAIRQNRKLDLTGILLYNGGFFLQMIEGPPSAVAQVYGKIAIDSRHQKPSLLYMEHVRARSYKTWSMGVLDSSMPAWGLTLEQLLERFQERNAGLTKIDPVESIVHVFEELTKPAKAA